jgi:hypothetical protein
MPPASLAGSGEKLGMDPRIDQPACCGSCREPFFLGSSEICPNLSTPHERLPRTGTARKKHTLCVRVVLVGFPLQSVHRFESP